MFIAGIQEVSMQGAWVTVLHMDRRNVQKKYRMERLFFYPWESEKSAGALFTDLCQDKGLVTVKKQFSQIGRPPKYRQVMPRILFCPGKGILSEGHRSMLASLSTPLPFILLPEKDENMASERAGEDDLVALAEKVLAEGRLDVKDGQPELRSPAGMSLGAALWGGEKIWRLVRYGG
ncbi:hypothetical protein LZ24_01983 [Desulfobotulus alkaliphilus]|uniref:Uncharacterized protein n=1 Tax=Desulfobotulus alkaliphilus TaxID=622671 RepID=A0A562RQ24_9BACT|nr:hypothetical protein [Desulfobotulus alkaliphilus]TWI71185.1 hypothetical protein LZ24_01983 [Desulfobotulus alkaliphilus]